MACGWWQKGWDDGTWFAIRAYLGFDHVDTGAASYDMYKYIYTNLSLIESTLVLPHIGMARTGTGIGSGGPKRDEGIRDAIGAGFAAIPDGRRKLRVTVDKQKQQRGWLATLMCHGSDSISHYYHGRALAAAAAEQRNSRTCMIL